MEFAWLHFLHAHCEAEEHVKHILGITGVAAQPNISDDYFKSKRAAFLNAFTCKTGLIHVKAAAAAMHINSICLAPPLPLVLLGVAKYLCMLVLLIVNFSPPVLKLSLFGDRLVLQGSSLC